MDYGHTRASFQAVRESTNGLGYWIWAKQVLDKQTIWLWKAFQVPQSDPVVHAKLSVSADNAFTVWMDGQEIGYGVDWRTVSVYDLSGKLEPGTHVLAVEGFNDNNKAGVIVGLQLKLADGQVLQIRSDTTWRVVPKPVSGWQTATRPLDDWPPATFIASLGQGPWYAIPTAVVHIRGSLPKPAPFWQTRQFQFMLFAVCAIFIFIGLYLLLQFLSQSKVHNALQVERNRIARDIHDDLSGGLTQLVLFGEVALSKLTEGSEARRQVAKVCAKARTLSMDMEDIVWLVNSQRDTFRDFRSYVCDYAETFLSATPIRCRFDVDETMPDLQCDLRIRRNLFLGIKEALNNALRHSGASELYLRIQRREGQMVVTIEDNGNGFDPVIAARSGNGLSNMMTRATEAGGVCRIMSRPGAGCRVEFTAPRTASGRRLKFWRHRPSTQVQILPASPEKLTP
ncbi:MAG TPA: ATP-binding protein [Candidatus Sulfotelmatobacter sp.]|nr:ATP-binding protein [Candidatus Sulfotelmatobacter sp.]